jgi:SAM-dependent methyltransferase
MCSGDVPLDWYRSSFSADSSGLYWEEEDEAKIDRALAMMNLAGHERILDLACTTGKRTLELSRRGFDVVGVDGCPHLLEVGGGEAELQDLYPFFVEADPREIDFQQEFDLVLSLGGGAFGHFDTDDEDLRAFEAVARALRPGGRLLMQVPNVLYAESQLPAKTWLTDGKTVELVEQFWNEGTRRLDGTTVTILADEFFGGFDPVPFERRLYSVEELAEIFELVGLHLADAFDENGERCVPTDSQKEIFVEARV